MHRTCAILTIYFLAEWINENLQLILFVEITKYWEVVYKVIKYIEWFTQISKTIMFEASDYQVWNMDTTNINKTYVWNFWAIPFHQMFEYFRNFHCRSILWTVKNSKIIWNPVSQWIWFHFVQARLLINNLHENVSLS